jgi:hypothetical protein
METYWAELDSDNLVIRVLVGEENSNAALEWLEENLGGRWVQTFVDAIAPDKYAAIGDTYDGAAKCFVSPFAPIYDISEVTGE